MAPCFRSYTASYQSPVVGMALSCTMLRYLMSICQRISWPWNED